MLSVYLKHDNLIIVTSWIKIVNNHVIQCNMQNDIGAQVLKKG